MRPVQDRAYVLCQVFYGLLEDSVGILKGTAREVPAALPVHARVC